MWGMSKVCTLLSFGRLRDCETFYSPSDSAVKSQLFFSGCLLSQFFFIYVVLFLGLCNGRNQNRHSVY